MTSITHFAKGLFMLGTKTSCLLGNKLSRILVCDVSLGSFLCRIISRPTASFRKPSGSARDTLLLDKHLSCVWYIGSTCWALVVFWQVTLTDIPFWAWSLSPCFLLRIKNESSLRIVLNKALSIKLQVKADCSYMALLACAKGSADNERFEALHWLTWLAVCNDAALIMMGKGWKWYVYTLLPCIYRVGWAAYCTFQNASPQTNDAL